ncbi:MAG: DUF3106 domain-containing protein [Terracidiphilus sp.]
MTRAYKTRGIGWAVIAAAAIALCTPTLWAHQQRAGTTAPQPSVPHVTASAPRAAAAPTQPAHRPAQSHPLVDAFGRPMANAHSHPLANGYPMARPIGPGAAYPGPPYIGPGVARPAYRGYAPPAEFPQGHLGDWLNQHRNLPVEEQERALRADPSFRRLAPADQQRVVSQLHQVNGLTEEQRQRRLARAEMIEHLSPQERMRINLSARRWAELPVDRQAQMKTAFRDLRGVPVEQRQTELDSVRYRSLFTPEERGILTDMLRVEPFQQRQGTGNRE